MKRWVVLAGVVGVAAGVGIDDDAEALEQLATALQSRVGSAAGDVKMLNPVLSETFRFTLSAGPRVEPRFIGAALWRAFVDEVEGKSWPTLPVLGK